jgi:transposase
MVPPSWRPEWVDFCRLLDVITRGCRPYRAKTKGKVERMVRELKESMLPWLSGQLLPRYPTLTDYHALAHRWIEQVVALANTRTTQTDCGRGLER